MPNSNSFGTEAMAPTNGSEDVKKPLTTPAKKVVKEILKNPAIAAMKKEDVERVVEEVMKTPLTTELLKGSSLNIGGGVVSLHLDLQVGTAKPG